MTLKNYDNSLLIEKHEVVNHLNAHFTNIGPTLSEHHTAPWTYYGWASVSSITEFHISLCETKQLIDHIDTTKSSTITHISSTVLRDTFREIPHALKQLINTSLDATALSDSWKHATITPLFKSGDRCDVNNHRPISQLPLPAKLPERIVHKRIYAHLTNHGLLTDAQGGFRPFFYNNVNR